MFEQDPFAADTDSMVGGSSSSCSYADAHISSLKEQLKEAHGKVEWAHNQRSKAKQQLQQWAGNSALHPAFLGAWMRVDDKVEMIITPNTVTFPNYSRGVFVIERLAPYVFKSKRDVTGGHALYTLLPSLDQLVKVNYDCKSEDSFSRIWVKKK
jgi:hypothetical protein